MKLILTSMLITLAILTFLSVPSNSAEPFKVIGVPELKTMTDENNPALVVIDSRSRSEYDEAHITGAISLPLHQMTADATLLKFPKESKLVFYCSGST